MNTDVIRCLCDVYSNPGTGKLESSHPWNSADSAVLEASLALKWCPGAIGPPGENAANAWPELQLRSKLRGFRDNRTGFTYLTQSIWRYMRLSGMVWHLLNCAQEAGGVLIRIAGAMFLSRQRNVDCGYSNMFEVLFARCVLSFQNFYTWGLLNKQQTEDVKSKFRNCFSTLLLGSVQSFLRSQSTAIDFWGQTGLAAKRAD